MSEFEERKCNINLERDIKSSYIFDRIFSYLGKRDKMNMIIYNNQLQKRFKVNIQDYKRISGKYKKGEKNGKGSEYMQNINIMIFEGEYKNGKKNGKGKEFFNDGKLIFEGEYLNGKRHGKGKEYSNNGNLKFEAEYLKGQKWNGKGYNINGIIDFEIKDGNGKGKEYNYNGDLKFEGEYLNGKKRI